jgi:hypothetical protein
MMGKLDVGVGDEFPVDEPAPPSPEAAEAVRSAREEWRQQKEEWRRGKAEWRAQRDAWKEDMRTRGQAFKADVRHSFHEHFGYRPHVRGFRAGGGFVPRLLIALALVALTIALLPFLFMFGFLILAAVLFFVALTRGFRRDDPPGRPTA